MVNYERIRKDCFWDLDISDEEINDIVKNNDTRKKNILFEKILLNSTALFQDLEVFDKEQLRKLLEDYKIPKFNADFAFRKKNLAEVYFFNMPLEIDELKWIA